MSLLGLASDIGREDEGIKLMPHNQILYDKIIAELNKGEHSIFYSEGTGLGKSFIFMKLVKDFFMNCRVLYVVPKIAIWSNLVHYKEFEYISDRVVMTTFTAFNRYPNESISCEDYDVVFVDECHHMLSDVQGKNIKHFMDDIVFCDKYVFGMTATPEIEGIFVDEECFDVSCYGLDMFEAIEQGLMPKMDIAIGIREEIDIPDNLREKYSVVGTKTLLETVISDYGHVNHWLAYFTTKEELEQNELELRKIFPEFKILKAYHGLNNVEDVISDFENSRQPVVLMTVSMFLEGMHLNKVGGVLLYRNVQRSHTYAQILGRLCVIGQKYSPVMVDVTGAILSIKQFYTPKSTRASDIQRKMYERKDVFDVTSRGYELLELAELLQLVHDNSWTEEEDNILREYANDINYLIAHLPNRTRMAIQRRRLDLGIKVKAHWSKEEIDILERYLVEEGSDIISRLPGKTYSACRLKGARLGLIDTEPRVNWTEDEDNLLLELYPVIGSKAFDRLPNHTESSCYGRVKKLGLALTQKWTKEEEDILRENCDKKDSDILELLPGRTLSSIRSRARRLGLGAWNCWTDEEDAVLETYYPSEGPSVCSRLPGRNASACMQRANSKGIFLTDRMKRWTKEEDEVLKKQYPINGKKITEYLPGRTESAISLRAFNLGIRYIGQ